MGPSIRCFLRVGMLRARWMGNGEWCRGAGVVAQREMDVGVEKALSLAVDVV